jgi:peptide/nickel transport system substrate-binding protein
MKRFDWRWLAVISVCVAAAAAAETRPQYGGTLHVALRAAPVSLDPTDGSQADSFARRSLTLLLFDTLVSIDESGRAQASLAASWQESAGGQRWQFHLRHGIKFQDGTLLTAESAAASLRIANPSWNVTASGDSVVIERDVPDPELPAELALPQNAIAKRSAGNPPVGTGPFHIVNWAPGKTLTLAADENYWRGRPFLDGIEIEIGRSFRDQIVALELGKVDLIEIAPEQVHRAPQDGHRLISSMPVELLALMFTRDAVTPEDKSLREALALSIERASIRSVLLQGAGQPAASILPDWMSGYGFVFPTDADLPRARHAREQVRVVPSRTVGYDSGDPIERLLTERIALNARDAGLSLQPTPLSPNSAAATDLRVVRIPLASADAWIALAGIADLARSPLPKRKINSIEELYAAEQSLLATQNLIPLFHLPVTCVATSSVKNWSLRIDGSLNLEDAWLGSGKP